MKKILGLTSTTYHLLVFLFIKEIYLKNCEVDLILTDKTPFLEELYKSGRLSAYFHNVYFADGRKIKNPYKNGIQNLWESFVYNKTTEEIITSAGAEHTKLPDYEAFYYASPGMPDEISKEIGKTLIRQNHHIRFYRFEDGFASYTKTPVSFITSLLGKKLYQLLFGFDIQKMEQDMYLFEPELAKAHTPFHKIRIAKSDADIQKVSAMAKDIFAFQSKDFSERFLFLGQGTANNSQNPVTYRRLINELANYIGAEDFILKPHPRGAHDDFSGTIKTYDDPCPFELAVANGTMENKVLISYYSTACISGKLLFQSNCKIIFLYPMAEDAFNEKCDYEDYFAELTKMYSNIYIPRNRNELFSLIDTLKNQTNS